MECDVQVLNEQLIHRNQQPTSLESVLLVDEGKPLQLYYYLHMKQRKKVMRLGMGSTKRKVHHLLKMRNDQRRKELIQIGSNRICDLPLLLQQKNMVITPMHYTFRKQHTRKLTCQVLMKS